MNISCRAYPWYVRIWRYRVILSSASQRSDRDFEDTMRLVREVHYAPAVSSMFARPGTPGADL